jgi:hypothetical protein
MDTNKQLQVVLDTEFPITKFSTLIWTDFST